VAWSGAPTAHESWASALETPASTVLEGSLAARSTVKITCDWSAGLLASPGFFGSWADGGRVGQVRIGRALMLSGAVRNALEAQGQFVGRRRWSRRAV
jgi:hypothetical protein